MKEPTIDFQQSSLAPRRKPETDRLNGNVLGSVLDSAPGMEPSDSTGSSTERQPVLAHLPEDERRRRGARRAAEQDDTRRRLKSLKRAKDRALRFYVNVPLEEGMKARLVRAAIENDVKMTVIMQAAIQTYLEDNGY